MGISPSSRVLILFAHPAPHRSRVNRVLLRAAGEVDGIHIRDLYELYPDLDIDVIAEQQALLDHDVVVMQHPLYWYSVPPILKEWMDLVLEHGWAYGGGGTRLRGKWLISAISTGGGESSYAPDGMNRYTMREFLRPIEQTAVLCKMHYLAPFLVQGTHQIGNDEIAEHASQYQRLLGALRDGRIDADRVTALERINDVVDALIAETDA